MYHIQKEVRMAKKSLFNLYLDDENRLDILKLQKADLDDLHALALELKIDQYNQLKKNDFIFKICNQTQVKMD